MGYAAALTTPAPQMLPLRQRIARVWKEISSTSSLFLSFLCISLPPLLMCFSLLLPDWTLRLKTGKRKKKKKKSWYQQNRGREVQKEGQHASWGVECLELNRKTVPGYYLSPAHMCPLAGNMGWGRVVNGLVEEETLPSCRRARPPEMDGAPNGKRPATLKEIYSANNSGFLLT